MPFTPCFGFLAENAEFARRCQAAGLRFVGPSSEVLQLFGDQAAARALAERCAVPLVVGNQSADQPEGSPCLSAEHGAVMLPWRVAVVAACVRYSQPVSWTRPLSAARSGKPGRLRQMPGDSNS
nr:biotin carboxylase N-terminal domain-containing protein [Pseudomonas peli]